MKLIKVIAAHKALSEMSCEKWPWEVALAVAHVKRSIETDAEFIASEESKLVQAHAARGEDGKVVINGGSFAFASPEDGDKYRKAQRELFECEAQGEYKPKQIRACDGLKPEWVEALDGFIEFTPPDTTK